MNTNPTLSAALVIYNFFKNPKAISYEKLSGRTYYCIKGTLRWYYVIEQMLQDQKIKKNKLHYCLLLVAIYQIKYLAIKNNLVLNETLKSCEKLKMSNMKGFSYAFLKKVERTNFDELDLLRNSSFLQELLENSLANNYERVAAGFIAEPQLCLTIFDKDKFIEKNKDHKMFKSFLFNCRNVVIPASIKPKELKGFEEGLYYIQNSVSTELLNLLDNKNQILNILDACCGVGGKTFLVKNFYKNKCHLTSIDQDKKKIMQLEENIKRLKIKPEKFCVQDALSIEGLYDIVLLDAPCSASGNIRKNPEIKFRISREELARLTNIQSSLLQSLSNNVKPGGSIIYMTCSILKEENKDQVNRFIKGRKDFAIEHIEQILPNEVKNGFFFCKIRRLI